MSLEEEAAGAVSRSIAQLIEKAILNTAGNAKSGAETIAAKFALGFDKYIATTLSRTNRAKTLITGNEPISLKETYEPVDLNIKEKVVTIDGFLDNMINGDRHALITATLGSGKSFTMRHLYRKVYERGDLLGVPVFIELRDVDFESRSIVDSMHESFEPFHGFLSKDGVQKCLRAGVFFLILDGFDEIKIHKKKKAQKEILDIAKNFPKNRIVVSSRKDTSRFMSWHTFPEYQVEPLSITKLNNLINKIPYSEEDKKSFLHAVNNSLFKTHRNLLSNPLLASMMLLTFKEFQEIPSKMHVFYGMAFEVLFRRHDSIKTDYKREFSSGLDMDTFRRFFMTFCFMSYIDREFSFKEGGHLVYLKNAAVYEELQVDENDLDSDVRDNICIMVQEGEQVDFIHRSFQEYFCALFLARRSIDQSFEFIDRLFHNYENHTNTVPMLIEIDKEEFERKFLIRKIENIIHRLENAADWKGRLKVFCGKYAFGKFGDNGSVDFIVMSGVFWLSSSAPQNANEVIQKTEEHYNWPKFYTKSYAKPGWESAVPRRWKANEHIRLFTPDDMTKKFYVAVGLERYMRELEVAIRGVKEDLAIKHGQKSTILKNVLKSASIMKERPRR